MTVTLLNSNRRALAILLGLFAGVLMGLIALLASEWTTRLPANGNRWYSFGFGIAIAASLPICIDLCFLIARSRLAYRDGELLINLGWFRQESVPSANVECFFLGRSPLKLPLISRLNPRVATVVVRLSESAGNFASRDLPRRWGKWEDGYITIYGTWCEPLSVERVNKLNAQFRQLTRDEVTTES